MSTARRISKNISLLFIAQIITYLIGFFITMYIARYLGAEGFGILSLALSITAILGITADLGLGTYIVREISKNKLLTDKYVSNTALMKVFLSFITFFLIFVLLNLSGYNETIKTVVYIITISVVINAFGSVLTSVFQANERMEYLSVSSILNSSLMLTGTLIGIYFGLDILYFAAIYVIANSINLIYIIVIYLWKYSFPKIDIDFSFWKPTIKEAWPFGITGLSGTIYTYIDSILLSFYSSSEVVGWYSAAYRLMIITLFIPTAVNTAIFPVMSRFHVSAKDSLQLMYEKYFKYMLILGIPIGFGTTILSDKIILLIYGQNYSESIIALQILIWTMVLTFAGASFVQLLQSINKQLLITKISIICVIFNIMLNLVLIPKFSYIGASIATVFTEIILIGYIFFVSFRLGYEIPSRIIIKDISKVAFASIIMSIFLLLLKELNLFILIITGTIVYFITLYLVKCIDDTDIEIVREILKLNK